MYMTEVTPASKGLNKGSIVELPDVCVCRVAGTSTPLITVGIESTDRFGDEYTRTRA